MSGGAHPIKFAENTHGAIMSMNKLYGLQAFCIFLQSANSGLSGIVHSPVATLLLTSMLAAIQFYLGHLCIQFDPTKKEKQ